MTNHIHKSLIRMATCLVVGLSLCLICTQASAVKFSQDELEKLKSGKLVRQKLPTSGKDGFYGGSSFAMVKAPVDVVWKAIQDFRSYTKIFPNTTEATEMSRKGDRSMVRLRLGHPLVNLQYHVELGRDADKRIMSFKLIKKMPNDINSIRGYWRLFPQKDGHTLIAYVVAVEVPMGLVNLAGPDLERRSFNALLGIPGDLRRWVEGPGGKKYYRKK